MSEIFGQAQRRHHAHIRVESAVVDGVLTCATLNGQEFPSASYNQLQGLTDAGVLHFDPVAGITTAVVSASVFDTDSVVNVSTAAGSSLTNALDTHEVLINTLADSVTNNETDFAAAINILDTRAGEAESAISTLEVGVTESALSITATTVALAELDNTVSTLDTNIISIEGRLDNNEDNISANATAMAELDNITSATTSALAVNVTAINDLNDEVTNLESDFQTTKSTTYSRLDATELLTQLNVNAIASHTLEYQTLEAAHQTLETSHQTLEAAHQTLEAAHQTLETNITEEFSELSVIRAEAIGSGILQNALPGFPVPDVSMAFIPSLQGSSIDFTDYANQKIVGLNDATTGSYLSTTPKTNPLFVLQPPDLKYSSANGFHYMETNGVDQGLGIDDFPISKIVSADGHSASIVCISTLINTQQVNFGWHKKNGEDSYDSSRRFSVHFPWQDNSFIFDFGSVDNGRVDAKNFGVADDVTIRTSIVRASETTQDINVDNVIIATGNPIDSFSDGNGGVVDEVGYLTFGHSGTLTTPINFSKMRCFAFLFYNRYLTDEEVGKINEWKDRKIGTTV